MVWLFDRTMPCRGLCIHLGGSDWPLATQREPASDHQRWTVVVSRPSRVDAHGPVVARAERPSHARDDACSFRTAGFCPGRAALAYAVRPAQRNESEGARLAPGS